MPDELWVCAECVDDSALKELISASAKEAECSFCGVSSDEPIGAPFDDIADHIRDCIWEWYDLAANCLPYESREGGYQGATTWDTYDLITDQLEIGFPSSGADDLISALCNHIGDETWCERNPFLLNPTQRLGFSWKEFCQTIKHRRRFFFLQQDSTEDTELYSAKEILDRIFSYSETFNLIQEMPAGKPLYRVRHQPADKKHERTLDLGPPPEKRAIQSNRMSPPGIAMTYLSEDLETALRETANEIGTYAVGEFKATRPLKILDLSQLPDIPSFFAGVSDSAEFNPRIPLTFLHELGRDISRPIARDDRIHIAYVPTQVVTEYVRSTITSTGQKIDGIRYTSSRHPTSSSLVLFANQRNLILPEGEQDPLYRYYDDRWLQLSSRSERAITEEQLAAWNQEYEEHTHSLWWNENTEDE